jgi:DNA-binding beta-propeller fold protein YncE
MKTRTGEPVTRKAFATTPVLLVAATLLWLPCLASSPKEESAGPHLLKLIDLPLPGQPSRFDYESLDSQAKRLYFSHMGDGELVVFNTETREVVAHLPGFPRTTGVLVVPDVQKVFVSVPGNHEVAIVDTRTLKVLSRVPDGGFPDGLAYAPEVHKVFVSDESGGKETVIDARTNELVGSIDLGGEVGNTQYDPASHRIFANVQSTGELVAIDPMSDRIVARHTLKGGDGPHGLLIDAPKRLAFAACEGDSKLLVVDMGTFDVKQVFSTGQGPDVLALDTGLERLYVATESGIVSIFQLHGRTLEKLQDLSVAPNAHTISVDSDTHEVYLPLKSVGGRPVLRIMKPPSP